MPTGPATTGREFSRSLGGADRLWKIPQLALRPLRLTSAKIRMGADMLYQFEQPFVVDSAKFSAKLTFLNVP